MVYCYNLVYEVLPTFFKTRKKSNKNTVVLCAVFPSGKILQSDIHFSKCLTLVRALVYRIPGIPQFFK